MSINASGQIVGDYYDGGEHGFLYSGGVYTTIDVSGSVDTEPRSINDSGQIGGLYQDSNHIQHGFLATPDTTAPAMLDAVQGRHHLTLLSGTAEVGSSVSVFDGTKLVGTVTAGVDGTWSLDANVTGNVIHKFTETSTLSGDTVSSTGVTLYSSAGHKSLVGGSRDDVLIGHANDILAGGAGSDTFVFNPNLGHETITNFNVNEDVIALDHTLFANATAAQVLSQTHDSNAGAVIVVDHADTITLPGLTVAQLSGHLSDFHLF